MSKKFDIFQVAGLNKNEEVHTSIIAELINPKSYNHDKGKEFLEIFAKIMGFNVCLEDIDKVTVETEVVTNNADRKRRIDMVISDGKTFIPFEVKIWAKDQDRQLADYCAFLKNKGKVEQMFYLTPIGRKFGKNNKIVLHGHEDVEVVQVYFQDQIAEWLGECMKIKDVTVDILEIMEQMLGNIRRNFALEFNVIDSLYEILDARDDIECTEYTKTNLTYRLRKKGCLEFALRIQKDEKRIYLYIICGVMKDDDRTFSFYCLKKIDEILSLVKPIGSDL